MNVKGQFQVRLLSHVSQLFLILDLVVNIN